ncbi:MAG: ShlB/FhaC/HecB family hemolysin secretion/activation protein [Cyanobacteriota bacterium]|nr:ShlB/FhaC/HecB family hemolysin secretion/activation protein [Cyanobacteriota bacterium]MDY6358888.1 ShlB/FhaC/HecB family hemolysin secretion/activation protein [Cyanobacteriota bacterium]MDY6363631.1 ShlB/FhaC/HecB family hemolysin secretion/activation protein [Cyanobacteriota bacterium]MDY6382611.1 ShlB/FhaC/HecB family hemolysin secretion/activation protein [Cyanobacteriota bacterium]
MKKSKNLKKIFGLAIAATFCCAFAHTPAFADAVSAAGQMPAGFGYTHGSIPVMQEAGGAAIHDADMMRYDRNSRIRDMDYTKYEKAKYGTEGSPVTNYAQPNDNYMKATIDEMGSKGVYVNSIEVSPSEILTKDEINGVIGQYVGKNVFMKDIQDAIDGLNKLYAEKGYVTARAYLPEQTVSNGNIKIELIESKIGKVSVVNNKYTTSNYILKRMPEKSGQLFDIVNLEQDVLDFNRYHDGVNLNANLKAGEQPGTTDIELTAQETFPFHLIGMMDNAGRRSTGQLRGGPAIVADSLFHHRDQMSLGSYFSKGAISPFFDYSYPINKKDGRIGFSFSSTFAQVKNGDAALKALGLKSNSYIYSLYYDQPLVRKRGFEFKTYTALNYKRSRTWSRYDDVFESLGMGSPFKDTDEVTSLDVGFNLRKDTKYGIWYLNQMASMAFPIFDSESSYFKYSGGLLRLHDFSHGFIGQLRSSYQIIPNSKHIPYMDLFQTGGLATVRGYSEGVLMGKNGYYVSGELMFPLLPRTITSKKTGKTHPFIGNYIKGAVFADTAGVFPWRGEDWYHEHDGSYFLASIGMGIRVQLPGDLSARLYWGYPLINNIYEQHRHMGRFHFELTLEPDFDALLAKRQKPEVVAPPPEPTAAPEPEPQPVEMPNNYDDVRHYDYLLDGSATAL